MEEREVERDTSSPGLNTVSSSILKAFAVLEVHWDNSDVVE